LESLRKTRLEQFRPPANKTSQSQTRNDYLFHFIDFEKIAQFRPISGFFSKFKPGLNFGRLLEHSLPVLKSSFYE